MAGLKHQSAERIELFRHFLLECSNGLAADILAEALKNTEIFETTGPGFGIFYHREAGRPYFEADTEIRSRARKILERAAEIAFNAERAETGHSKETYARAAKCFKACRSTDFLGATLKLFAEKVIVQNVQWNSTAEALCCKDAVIDYSGPEPVQRDAATGEYWREPLPLRAEEILNAGPAPAWEQFVENLFPNDIETRRTFLQGVSLAMRNRTVRIFQVWINKFGSNGKDTVHDILSQTLGTSAVGMLAGDLILRHGDAGARRFGAGELENLRFGFFDEISGIFDISSVKNLTGGSSIRAEKKGQNPKLLLPCWNLAALTNCLPSFYPADDYAFLSRLLIIPFETVFYMTPEEHADRIAQGIPAENLRQGTDRQALLSDLARERAGIIRALIAAYCEMRDQYGGRPFESEACRKAKLEYRASNDVVQEFIAEFFKIEDLGRVEIGRVVELWRTWTGDKKTTERKILKMVREKVPGAESKSAHGKRYIAGIREKTESDETGTRAPKNDEFFSGKGKVTFSSYEKKSDEFQCPSARNDPEAEYWENRDPGGGENELIF